MALRSVPSAARISYEARAEEVSMENKLAGMNLGSSRLSFEPARFSAMVGSHSGGNLAAGENAVAEYQAWKTLHPCALEQFDRFVAEASGKLVAVFLDYDGTLTPIVSNPDAAFMSEEMRSVVRSVAQLFPTAIVSGRGREKVEGFVQLKELYYAGSHGMDIVGPQVAGCTADVAFQAAAQYAPLMDAVCAQLEAAVASIPGASVEHNKFCVSVHFRNCAPGDWPAVVAAVDGVAAGQAQLRVTRGRKVLEVRPQVDWDKGDALLHLLGALGLASPGSVFAVYIGDDRTDEDAFKVLAARGLGAGVLVSTKVKPTAAAFTLQDPSEVAAFLGRLVDWGRTAGNLWHGRGGCKGWALAPELRLSDEEVRAAATACAAGTAAAAGAGCAKDLQAAMHVGDAAAAAAALLKDGYRLPVGGAGSNGRCTAASKLAATNLWAAQRGGAAAAAAGSGGGASAAPPCPLPAAAAHLPPPSPRLRQLSVPPTLPEQHAAAVPHPAQQQKQQQLGGPLSGRPGGCSGGGSHPAAEQNGSAVAAASQE